MLFLGDQVYADETSDEMQKFIESRRDIDEPPGEELADYEEYSHLYKLAWSDPANRWLLSTLPSAMIFDDHDIRDDWNTSARWRREMEATDWWHGRIVAGLASYWVYQHLGNLTPEERSQDEIWQLVVEHDGEEELDLSDTLDAFAERVDQKPETYRWSYARELGEIRLVVVDSRAARVLQEDQRSMLDPDEMAWLDEHMQGDCEHLLVGTSLPFLLPEGLHHLEAFSEALAGGAWGRRGVKVGETMRQGADLEHWGAFQEGFQDVARMAAEVATGHRGTAAEDRHVPLRGRPPQLRLPGARRPRGRHDPAGGLLTDPQPAAAGDAAGDRRAGLRHRHSAGACDVALGIGAGPAVPLGQRARAVVRQQHRDPRRGGRRRPRDALGVGAGPGRPSRAARPAPGRDGAGAPGRASRAGMTRRFTQADVFTAVPLLGNPVAVVHDADGMSDDEMAAVARWTNLSETTFLLPPSDPAADYRVRIFTTSGELPFAGHPTLGSAHAWLAAGGVAADEDVVVQECGVGLVEVRRGGRPAFAAPPLLRSGPLDDTDLDKVLAAAGVAPGSVVDAAWVDNGPGWVALELRSVRDVLAAEPVPGRTAGISWGLVARYEPDDPARDGRDAEVRGFFDGGDGWFEDPVTGSLNAGLAQWLIGAGRLPASYVAGQGQRVRRDGRVHVEQVGDRTWVGGDVVTVVHGEVDLGEA